MDDASKAFDEMVEAAASAFLDRMGDQDSDDELVELKLHMLTPLDYTAIITGNTEGNAGPITNEPEHTSWLLAIGRDVADCNKLTVWAINRASLNHLNEAWEQATVDKPPTH